MSHRDAAAAAKEETMSDTQNTPPFPDTEPASMNGAAAQADTSEALARVAELEAKNVELADAYLRAKAEMENIRRRADEEVAKSRKFAVESFAESLLPVCDSLEAALAVPQATAAQLREGSDATLRQLLAALERNKVLPIHPAAGEGILVLIQWRGHDAHIAHRQLGALQSAPQQISAHAQAFHADGAAFEDLQLGQ